MPNDQSSDDSHGSDYQAPKLYESSSFLSKYSSSSSTDDATTSSAPDLAADSASIADALASSAVNLTSSASTDLESRLGDAPATGSGASGGSADDFTISFDDDPSSSGTDDLLAAAAEHGLTDASADVSIDRASTAAEPGDAETVSPGWNATETYAESTTSTGTASTPAITDDERPGWTPSESIDRWDAKPESGAPATAPRVDRSLDRDLAHNQRQKQAKAHAHRPTPPAGGDGGDASSGTRPTPKSGGKKSHQLIYWALGAVAAAIFGIPWAAVPLGIGVLVASGLAIAGKWGTRWLGVVGLILAIFSFVTLGVQAAGGNPFSNGSSSATGTLDVATSATISGTGDAELYVTLPDGPTAFAAIEVTLTGDSIRIRERDPSGDLVGYSTMSMYSEGTQVFPINTEYEETVNRLEIEATGDWSITLLSLDDLPSFDEATEGTGGEQLLVYTGDGGDAVFTLPPDSWIDMKIYTEGEFSWSNSFDGVTSVTMPWKSGPLLLWIDASDSWSVTVEPAGTPSG